MSTIDFGKTVTLAEAADLICMNPDVRYEIVGEPGIGKTTLVDAISARYPDHAVAMINVPEIDLGDIALPAADHLNKIMNYYPNARFHVHTGKPVLIFLDEWSKGNQAVKNMLQPVLDVREPRLGDWVLHPSTIVIMTGNLTTDNVGDSNKAHTKNRRVVLRVSKPTAKAWLNDFAKPRGLNPVVCAWVDRNQHCMASYTEAGSDSNPYIYNPRKVQDAFVTGRSLEIASKQLYRREGVSQNALACALTGTLGMSAGLEIMAFIEYQDQLPSIDEIVSNPRFAPVPTASGACAVLAYSAVHAADASNLSALIQYFERIDAEWQAIFMQSLASDTAKQSMAFRNGAFTNWMEKNADLI